MCFGFVFFHTLGVCIAAPKRSREAQPEKAFLLAIPPLKSQKQRQYEEDLGEALKALFHNNKISAAESFDILDKCQKCGLEFKNPVKDTFNSKAKANKPEEEKEPGEAARKNASRTLKRFMRKKKEMGTFLLVSDSNVVSKNQINTLGMVTFLASSWVAHWLYVSKGYQRRSNAWKGRLYKPEIGWSHQGLERAFGYHDPCWTSWGWSRHPRENEPINPRPVRNGVARGYPFAAWKRNIMQVKKRAKPYAKSLLGAWKGLVQEPSLAAGTMVAPFCWHLIKKGCNGLARSCLPRQLWSKSDLIGIGIWNGWGHQHLIKK